MIVKVDFNGGNSTVTFNNASGWRRHDGVLDIEGKEGKVIATFFTHTAVWRVEEEAPID